MFTKLTPKQYLWAGLFIFLAACGKQMNAMSIQTPIPTLVSPTSVPTPTLKPVTLIPSPFPLQPTIPILTPNTIQLKRWKDYQTELAKLVLAQHAGNEVL